MSWCSVRLLPGYKCSLSSSTRRFRANYRWEHYAVPGPSTTDCSVILEKPSWHAEDGLILPRQTKAPFCVENTSRATVLGRTPSIAQPCSRQVLDIIQF